MIKRVIFIILALLIVVGIVAGIKFLQIRTMIEHGGAFTPPPAVVTSAVAEKQEWEITLNATGSLEAVQGVMVASEQPGKVTGIEFESGEGEKGCVDLMKAREYWYYDMIELSKKIEENCQKSTNHPGQ